jgi:hypothetical protein
MTDDERYQALERLLAEAGYERDERRCQWRRGPYFVSDETLWHMAQTPEAAGWS